MSDDERNSMTEVLDAQVVEEGGDPATELVPAQPAPPPNSLFRTDDPVEVIARATTVANALKAAVQSAGLISNIKGKEYPRVEAWQTLGSMLGVVPVCAWTRPVDNGWEARVEARTLDGRVIGAAEAECTKDEKTWKTRDSYALRSMAQTRATSKALRGPLGFVMSLAGYEATPAEEMPTGEALPPREPEPPKPKMVGKKALEQLEQALGRYIEKGLEEDRIEAKLTTLGVELGAGEMFMEAFRRLSYDDGKQLYEWLTAETEGGSDGD